MTQPDSSSPAPGLGLTVVGRWRRLALAALLGLAGGYGASYMIDPVYQTTTVVIPPQPAQSAATGATAALGALAGLSGTTRSTTDQFAAYLQSATVADRLIDRFGLMVAYREKYREMARKTLAKRTKVSTGKKDGLITLSVEDTDPARAVKLAEAYVEELRTLTARIAVTEAQQRRAFFEQQMQAARGHLVEAQKALAATGVTEASLKAEPKAAAEGYAKLRAELNTAEVRLSALRASMTENSPEVRIQATTVASLRGQLSRLEGQTADAGQTPAYIERYREFKYHEALFDMMARQYEVARVDEAREGAIIQVLDAPSLPERKVRPQRVLMGVGVAAGLVLLCLLWIVGDRLLWGTAASPAARQFCHGLRRALSGR